MLEETPGTVQPRMNDSGRADSVAGQEEQIEQNRWEIRTRVRLQRVRSASFGGRGVIFFYKDVELRSVRSVKPFNNKESGTWHDYCFSFIRLGLNDRQENRLPPDSFVVLV